MDIVKDVFVHLQAIHIVSFEGHSYTALNCLYGWHWQARFLKSVVYFFVTNQYN